jgi:hypothetical protein
VAGLGDQVGRLARRGEKLHIALAQHDHPVAPADPAQLHPAVKQAFRLQVAIARDDGLERGALARHVQQQAVALRRGEGDAPLRGHPAAAGGKTTAVPFRRLHRTAPGQELDAHGRLAEVELGAIVRRDMQRVAPRRRDIEEAGEHRPRMMGPGQDRRVEAGRGPARNRHHRREIRQRVPVPEMGLKDEARHKVVLPRRPVKQGGGRHPLPRQARPLDLDFQRALGVAVEPLQPQRLLPRLQHHRARPRLARVMAVVLHHRRGAQQDRVAAAGDDRILAGNPQPHALAAVRRERRAF